VINCDKEAYRRFMIEKVVTVIKLRCPDCGLNRTAVIQHDGASCHTEGNDVQFDKAATSQGVWNICLEKQPAKSPDMNELDLSFFRALQAKQLSLGSDARIDDLIAQVLQLFVKFEPRKIDCWFSTLQTCMNDMTDVNGGNDFKI
jgi:hypothetical protein